MDQKAGKWDYGSRKRMYAEWIIIGGALLCFAYVAYQVSSGRILSFDETITHWVYTHRTPLLNSIWIPITYLGNWQTITLLGILLLLYKGTRKNIGIPFTIISLSSTVLYKVVKTVFQRPRPDIAVRIIEQGGFSFPSGHSMNGIVCFGILIYLIRRYCRNRKLADGLTAFLILLIAAIGFSRVYVGVHYPTDIIGGWSLGLAYLLAAIYIFEKIRGRENDLSKNH